MDITESVDRECEREYGHRNWSYDKDNNVVVAEQPHNEDGDCLCANDCLLEEE
tara:strand:+ start:1757 stop:1915 length:159 start_codon:yes stop_codon:yes gene_type:complete